MFHAHVRKVLEPEHITVAVDTREKTPLDLKPLRITSATLDTGDYSVAGLEQIIAVERKSLQDLLTCIGTERERFEREIQRLMAYPVKALVIEATISQIQAKMYRGKVHPNAALGSIMGWMVRGLPVIWAENHITAGELTAKFLYLAAKREWAKAYPFLASMAETV